MKKIGIVGGVAWPSTIEYYRLICQGANEHFKSLGGEPPYPTPPITIESIVMSEARKLRAGPDDEDEAWEPFAAVYRNALLRLEEAGCDFAILANNTSHNRLNVIKKGLNLPVISIIDETANAAKQAGAEYVLVLGTSVTMQSDAYAQALAARGITANERLPDGITNGLQSLIDTDFYEGCTSAGRAGLLELCHKHVPQGAKAMIALACTELPLAFPNNLADSIFEDDGLSFINTSAVHAKAALNRSLGLES